VHTLKNSLNNSSLLRSLFNAFPDVIILKDREGRWIQANSLAQQLLGLKDDQWFGKTDMELMKRTDNDRDIIEFSMSDTLTWEKREPSQFEEVLSHPDGTIKYFDTVKIPFFQSDGKPQGLLVVARDITDRKKSVEALKEAEQKYRNLVEKALVGVYLIQGNHYLYVNPRFVEIFGYDSQEEIYLLGLQDLISPKERRISLENIYKRMSGEIESIRYQSQGVKKDGTIIDVDVHGSRTIYNGKPAIIGTLADITDQKRAEEFMRRSEKLSVIGELAAGVAHEIRNPLTSIKGFIQLFQQGFQKKEYFELITSELNRIETIVSEFLVLAKPQVIPFQKKDLVYILRSTIVLLMAQANLSNIQFRMEFDCESLFLYCGESQLKQVFINVIKNAIEAMPNGGEIWVKLKLTEENQVMISFVDKGQGIPLERVNRLGEPFYTTKEKGTGLGLMVSYRIIEAHNGRITVNSEPGLGTTIDVILPLG
jgi:two-component system, sporulation sensor kinase A